MRQIIEQTKAVIFDLDGSLVDSMWLWKEIDIEYFQRFHKELPETLQSEIEGMSFHETAVYIKEQFQFPDSIEQMKSDWNQMAWDKYRFEVPLKDGIPEFLQYCKKHSIKLGIASSNSKELIREIVRVHKLEEYFQVVMSACEVGKGKPSPDIYLAVAKRLQTEPAHCLVFEDIVPGILAGKRAGMHVCAVEDEYSAAQKKEKKDLADYYIKNYYDVGVKSLSIVP